MKPINGSCFLVFVPRFSLEEFKDARSDLRVIGDKLLIPFSFTVLVMVEKGYVKLIPPKYSLVTPVVERDGRKERIERLADQQQRGFFHLQFLDRITDPYGKVLWPLAA